MVSWRLVYTKQARKDAKKLAAAGLRPKAEFLLEILKKNPFQSPPPFKKARLSPRNFLLSYGKLYNFLYGEKLVGDLEGAYSRKINIQHRLVYQVLKRYRAVKVIRMWTHYE